ncbi:MAG: DUF3592 domain-containing protein, partial [Armatimonadota bacterium]|nr:DUF3592 domain-containing protein [Armatimonadota bacterium]
MATFKTTLFTVIGACIILAALVSAWGTQRFVAGASSASGIVTRLNADGSHPEVRFTTADGRTIEFALNGLIFGYRVRDRVKILYNPRRPTEAT